MNFKYGYTVVSIASCNDKACAFKVPALSVCSHMYWSSADWGTLLHHYPRRSIIRCSSPTPLAYEVPSNSPSFPVFSLSAKKAQILNKSK